MQYAEGTFEDRKWITVRRLKGDEVHATTGSGTGLKLPEDKVRVQKIKLYRFRVQEMVCADAEPVWRVQANA